jgi:hypothetical protein
MKHDQSAASMVTGVGELVHTAYNLRNELVGAREPNASLPTSYGAHFGNTDPEGFWVTGGQSTDGVGNALPSEADWIYASLCSAHLEEVHQWGPGEGVEDRLFLTNEEWTLLADDPASYVGLSAHVVDTATKTAYAAGVFTMGGFEKIVEIKSGHKDYTAWAISGYNGHFGDYPTLVQKRNDAYGKRTDGMPYVKPKNIVPTRVFVGKKGLNEKGEIADDFLSRNGLRFGQLYGFATNIELDRDPWHKANYKGATVKGGFYPVDWKWTGEVKSFEHDGSFAFQDHPVGAPADFEFWTALGPNTEGKKTEHVSPSHNGKSAYSQTSTAGYIGEYDLTALGETLGALKGNDMPAVLDATYFLYQGETPVNGIIDLGGKGIRADGKDQTFMTDSSTTHATFEDVDGYEVILAADGRYSIICEDGGNVFGERLFIAELTGGDTPMDYKFIAQAGGKKNTRALNKVGIPAGTAGKPNSNEFSGTADLSSMLLKDAKGAFKMLATDSGFTKHVLESEVKINDKVLLVGLQAHNLNEGVISAMGAGTHAARTRAAAYTQYARLSSACPLLALCLPSACLPSASLTTLLCFSRHTHARTQIAVASGF